MKTSDRQPERKWARIWIFLLLVVSSILIAGEWPFHWKSVPESYALTYNSALLFAGTCLAYVSSRTRCYSRAFLAIVAIVGLSAMASALISSGYFLQYQRHIFKSERYVSPHEIVRAKERLRSLDVGISGKEVMNALGLSRYCRMCEGGGPWKRYHMVWFLGENHTLAITTDNERHKLLRVSIDGEGRDF